MADGQDRTTRRVDWFALICGIATLLVAGYVLGDGPVWMAAVDMRWVLTGVAATVGIGLLASSLRDKS